MVTKYSLLKVCLFASLLALLSACENLHSGSQPAPSGTNRAKDVTASTTDVAVSAQSIVDNKMGLSKTSVFDTPEPDTVSYNEKFPGLNTVLPRSYPGAPSQIPHYIEPFTPITANKNICLKCHDKPSMHGKVISKGLPTPIPESHYRDLRHKPDVLRKQLVEGRYVCTQCHVPQADARELVENTFGEQTK